MSETVIQNLEKKDRIAAVSSGALTAALDIFYVKDLSLEDAHKWGKEKTDEFVRSAARKKGYKGDDLAGAISYLEEKAPVAQDKLTNSFGGGYFHHIRDFSHHPTPAGLIFSIIAQMTGRAYGADVNGNITEKGLPEWRPQSTVHAVYKGSVVWFWHMISDMDGSSSSARMGKEGTGLPGPMMSLLKELSAIPGIKNIAGMDEKGRHSFSVACQKMFDGTMFAEHDENGKIIKPGVRFDLRTELGLVNESFEKKAHIPVMLNKLITAAYYTISRFIKELDTAGVKTAEDLRSVDPENFLPFGNPCLRHMQMIASVTFSAIDITEAGIRAALHNKDDKNGFARDFVQRINFPGIGDLILMSSSEAMNALSGFYDKYRELIKMQTEGFDISGEEMAHNVNIADRALRTAGFIAAKGSVFGYIDLVTDVYEEVADAVREYDIAHEQRLSVEKKCREEIMILREEREEMEACIEDYMYDNLYAFSGGLDLMEISVRNRDSDGFIEGNNIIQKQLGKEIQFEDQSQFEELMKSDKAIRF